MRNAGAGLATRWNSTRQTLLEELPDALVGIEYVGRVTPDAGVQQAAATGPVVAQSVDCEAVEARAVFFFQNTTGVGAPRRNGTVAEAGGPLCQ